MQASRGTWIPARHLLALSRALVDLENGFRVSPDSLSPKNIEKNGETQNLIKTPNILIVTMPPRHGKSELISKYYPAWRLGVKPDERIILSSYEAGFAASWGRKVRDLLEEFGDGSFEISIRGDTRSASYFEIANFGGSMTSVGAGGSITGRGANLLIIDDPVKNDAEANSPTIKNNVWDWFRSTAYTRLEPEGKLVLVMTRWSEDDLCGRLIDAYDPKDYRILSFPAIARATAGTGAAALCDELGRKPGEALWPERFDERELTNIKSGIGSYRFSALYMQSPAPIGGGIFRRKFFRYFKERGRDVSRSSSGVEANLLDKNRPHASGSFYEYKNSTGEIRRVAKSETIVVAAVDLAVSASERSDFTAAAVVAVSPERDIFLIDLIAERIEGADHLNFLRRLLERRRPRVIGVESVQYQMSLVQSALREGLPVKALRADSDKLSRALPAATLIESGKVYFPERAPWLDDFERELTLFPNSAHDDRVDAFAYCFELASPISKSAPAGAKLRRGKGVAKDFGG